jgi:hypothetical protein
MADISITDARSAVNSIETVEARIDNSKIMAQLKRLLTPQQREEVLEWISLNYPEHMALSINKDKDIATLRLVKSSGLQDERAFKLNKRSDP